MLAGQEAYLTGVTLVYWPWKAVGKNDHDHCEFCWAKFSDLDGCLHEGYSTLDRYRWICRACYAEFKERFGWKLQEPEAE